jgi:hypothetical protein
LNGTSRSLDLSYLATVCTSIANEVSDESGFVSMRGLLARFGVDLIIRPLLVEGMLAKIAPEGGDADTSDRWAVLLDRDRYQVSDASVREESAIAPLPPRMRFTIAHELAHSLAFRPTQFGLELRHSVKDKQSAGDFVKAVERETDKLSSLLLWPERAMEAFLSETPAPLSIERLTKLRRDQGISRHVLLNRLRAFQTHDKRALLQREENRNVGIGIGEWTADGTAVFRSWPTFLNFDRNVIPQPFLKIVRQDRIPTASVLTDAAFWLCGGSSPTTTLLSSAGVPTVPDAEKMMLAISVERAQRKPGVSFLYVISRESDNARSNIAVLENRRARSAP